MHNNNKDRFEELVNDKLWSFEAEPASPSWQAIQQKISGADVNKIPRKEQVKWGKKLFTILGGIVVTSIVFYLFFSAGKNNKDNGITKKENVSAVNDSFKTSEKMNISDYEINTHHAQEETSVENTTKETSDKKTLSRLKKETPAADHTKDVTSQVPENSNSLQVLHNEALLHHVDSLEVVAPSVVADTHHQHKMHKSFYEKKLKDSTLKAQKLFK